MDPSQRMMDYFGVSSIGTAMKEVARPGGAVSSPKMAVPGRGYLANCLDTEGNASGLWEENPAAE